MPNRGIACGFSDDAEIPPSKPHGNLTAVMPVPHGTKGSQFEPCEVPLKANGEVIGTAMIRPMDDDHLFIVAHLNSPGLAEALREETPHAIIAAKPLVDSINFSVTRDG